MLNEIDLSNNNNYDYYNKNNKIDKKFYYKITNDTFGPFDYTDNEIKLFLNDVSTFRIIYSYMNYVPLFYEDNLECTKWTIQQKYSYVQRSHFIVSLDIDNHHCDESFRTISGLSDFINKLMWIHVIVLILAVVSLILIWKHIQKLAAMFVKAKNKNKVNIYFLIKL
jgi:hypothetical protein